MTRVLFFCLDVLHISFESGLMQEVSTRCPPHLERALIAWVIRETAFFQAHIQ